MGVTSTPVTASHMTQGRVEYESMIPRGMDKGLDLWEAKSDVHLTYLNPNHLIIQDICVAFSLLYRAQYLANYQLKNIITRFIFYSKDPLSRVKKEVHNSIKNNNSSFHQMRGCGNLPVRPT